jgi:hypothetical protein
VALSFTGTRLGRLDLRIEIGAGGVSAAVTAAVGEPHARAHAAADALTAALEAATGRPARVRVSPRRDPLDLYA